MQGQRNNMVTVAGMGRSGKAVVEYMAQAGIVVDCCDDREDYADFFDALHDYQGWVIKSPGVPSAALPQLPAEQVINDIELFLRLTRKPVIMVTGTNGKSTVVALLEHILKDCGIRTIACGNNAVPVLSAYKNNLELVILELSSYQLENMKSLTSVSAAVLNIAVDHVDRYKNFDEYASIKKKIYTNSIAPVWPINVAGEVDYSEHIQGYATVSLEGKSKYVLVGDSIFKGCKPYMKIPDIKLYGEHNYLNICAALALLDHFELADEKIMAAIKSFTGLPHRMEVICRDSSGRLWINDSKSTNLHSLKVALKTQKAPVCLIMGGVGKGEDYLPVLTEFKHIINKLITYGQDSDLIVSRAPETMDSIAVKTLPEAITEAAHDKANVLFSPACASFDQYKDFSERGDDFRRHVEWAVTC